VHREAQPIRLAAREAHPRHELPLAGIVERAHRSPLGLLMEVDLPERIRSPRVVRRERGVRRARHLREPNVLELELGVVRRAEHAVHSQRRSVDARHPQIRGDLRCPAPVAEHVDVDCDLAGRDRREEDGVRGDELEIVTRQRLVMARNAAYIDTPPKT
jgi:hypothetical protein